MTQQEIVQLFTMVAMAYPRDSAFSNATPMMVEMWTRGLQDIPFDLIQKALFVHIRTSIYPPAVSELASLAIDFANGGDGHTPTSEEEWATVEAAIKNSAYESVREFHKLSPKCQKLVGSPNQLYEWSQCETGSTALSFARERFLRQHDIILSNEKQARSIPQELKTMLGRGEEKNEPQALIGGRQLPSREDENKAQTVDDEANRRAQKFFDLAKQIAGGKKIC